MSNYKAITYIYREKMWTTWVLPNESLLLFWKALWQTRYYSDILSYPWYIVFWRHHLQSQFIQFSSLLSLLILSIATTWSTIIRRAGWTLSFKVILFLRSINFLPLFFLHMLLEHELEPFPFWLIEELMVLGFNLLLSLQLTFVEVWDTIITNGSLTLKRWLKLVNQLIKVNKLATTCWGIVMTLLDRVLILP